MKKLRRKAEQKSDKIVQNRNELGQPGHQDRLFEWSFRVSLQCLIRDEIYVPGQARTD